MSGFEIAGIVLGSIPLLISALEHYADGLSTLQRWRKYKREINSLIRNLETERIKLENVCEKLLINIVPHSEIENLISNPMGNIWTNQQTLEKIQFRLGKSFKVFEATVIDLRTSIDEMAARIDSKSGGMIVGIKRVVFTLSRSHYTELLSDIREGISNLENLTDRNMELEPARRTRSRERLFTILRAMSDSLYRTLRSNLHCSCAHDIGLELENRISAFIPTHDEEKAVRSTSFQIVISYTQPTQISKAWQQIKAEPIQSAPESLPMVPIPPPLAKRQRLEKKVQFSDMIRHSSSTAVLYHAEGNRTDINSQMPSLHDGAQSPFSSNRPFDLCSCVKYGPCPTQTNGQIFGTVFDGPSLNTNHFILSPVPPSHSSTRHPSSIISLKDILERKTNTTHLPLKDCLRLAVVAASNFLLLHASDWVPSQLSSNDIVFFTHQGPPTYSSPFLIKEHLGNKGYYNYIKATLAPSFSPALWSLGLLLLELILGNTMESLRVPKDESGDGSPLKTTQGYSFPDFYFTAYRLLEQVPFESSNYRTAIIRCLEGNLQNGSHSMGSSGFCQEMYSGIIALLEKDLQAAS